MTGLVATTNLDNPPEVPPEGCVGPVMWRLAWSWFALHRCGVDSVCITCRQELCSGPSLAGEGLATALGFQVPLSSYWIAFTRVMRNLAHTRTAE